MVKLSKRAQNLKTSPTLFLVAKAKELAAQGHDVISLTVGEPDWPTFTSASQAGIEAIEKGMTKYSPASGTVELRKTIAKKLSREIGIEYSEKEITVASGAKFVLFAALQVLMNEGDEIIIPAPYWVSYPTMAELAGAKPVLVECGEEVNFKITASMLEKAINEKTKAFLICSPSNPTGIQYSEQELQELAEVLKKHPDIVIISDDIYNRLTFSGDKVAPHILKVAPELRDRAVLINGGSKTYSMTGWRIGWGSGPQNLITAMADYQSQSTGSPSTIAQYALQKSIEQSETDIEEVVKKLIRRKDLAVQGLQEISSFRVIEPDGAFYLWVDIKSCLGKTLNGRKLESSRDFCDVLLNTYFVSTVPGIESGVEGFMRLSFAVSEEDMQRAIGQMKEMVSVLK